MVVGVGGGNAGGGGEGVGGNDRDKGAPAYFVSRFPSTPLSPRFLPKLFPPFKRTRVIHPGEKALMVDRFNIKIICPLH